MNPRSRIIRDNHTLFINYDQLNADDLICCRIRFRKGEEHLLLDLAERGVRAIPSFRSQLCSRSKAFQTRLFPWAMAPDTTVIYDVHDLLQAIGRYGRSGCGRVVVKQEGKNGGLGILLFSSIEEVYTQTATGVLPRPFVIQPFVPIRHDLRVIVLGDYVEAYERVNPHCFRQNLHCGGTSRKWELTDGQEKLCRAVMRAGGFPYAHIDLMVTTEDETYLSEINLRGGLRGARISSPEYRRRIEAIKNDLCAAV